MAENISLNNVATFQNDTSAVNTVNSNNAAITTAFTDVLSRSGVSPNQMGSTLDMNGNQIINLPFPTTLNSPARVVDVTSAQNITIVNATTGTSGHTVPFLDGANTWSNTQTIATPSGTAQGLVITQTSTGSVSSPFNINNIQISDSLNAGSSTVSALGVLDSFGTSSVTGARTGVLGQVQLNSATNAANANRYYAGVQGFATALTADTGTNPNVFANIAGEIVGGNFTSILGASATSYVISLGAEFNTICQAGSSTWAKALVVLAGGGANDLVAGSVANNMLWMYNHTGGVKWTNGIM